MIKLARFLKLKYHEERSFYFKFLAKMLNRFVISGKMRGRGVEVFNFSENGIKTITKSVAQVELAITNRDIFNIRGKRGIILSKIFGKTFFPPRDIILDKRIVIESGIFSKTIEQIFSLDELKEKMSALWTKKYHRGILLVGANKVTYFEPFSLWTLQKKKRFLIALHLLCDIADAIELQHALDAAHTISA